MLDALTYNEHSGKAGKIDLGDVELAVQAKVNWEFKESGERDVRCDWSATTLFAGPSSDLSCSCGGTSTCIR